MTGLRLSRYVGTSYLGAVLLTTTGLTMLVVAASMIEGGSRLAGAGVGTVLKLALFQGLAFSYQILPAASFLGALIAGTLLARRGELLGVQVSGIGMGPIWRGFTGVALLVAFSGYMLGEWVVPPAVNGLERTQEDELEGRQDGITAFYAYRLSWFRSGDLVLHLPSIADQDATVFETPAVYETREGELVAIIEAERLRFQDGSWTLENAARFDVKSGDTVEHTKLPLELKMSGEDIAKVTGDPRQMRLGSVEKLIERRERAGFDATSHRIEYHTRLAYPLNALWMLLIALPWALHPDRRRSLAVNLGAGVAMVAVLFVVLYTFRLLALGHKIPVSLGGYGIFITCLVLVPASAWSYRRYRVRGSVF